MSKYLVDDIRSTTRLTIPVFLLSRHRRCRTRGEPYLDGKGEVSDLLVPGPHSCEIPGAEGRIENKSFQVFCLLLLRLCRLNDPVGISYN